MRAPALVPLLLANTALAASAAAAAPASGPGSYARTVDGVVVIPASGPARRVRLQVMTDGIVHVVATPTDSLDVPKSLMVVAQPERVRFTTDVQGDELRLHTGRVTAEVSLRTGVVDFRDAQGRVVLAERDRGEMTPTTVEGRPYLQLRQVFNPNTDEGFYGLGQHQNAQMDYNGEDVELAQHNTDVAIPFVLSTKNYGVLWDNNSITRFGDPRPYALASRDVQLYSEDGHAGGLSARYYVGDDLKLSRVEPDVDYWFNKERATFPAALHGQHGARVVWTGFVEARRPGVQKFQVYESGYVKVYVDDKLVLDRWRQNWNAWYRPFDVEMKPGERHKIRIEWIPEDGYIAFLHDGPLPDAERHSLSLFSEAGSAIDYYYVAGNNLDDVVAGYRHLTGKAPLAPRWAYGFWQSRQRYETTDQVLGVVKEYRRRGLPLDNIVQDWLYWRKDDWGSHKFDLARYPDPKGMIDQIHALNAHFMISVWPKFYTTTDNFKELNDAGYLYQRNLQVGSKDWVGYVNTFYDPYAQRARDIYWRQIHDRLDTLGVDAWWLDASEPDTESNIDTEERKLRMSPTALGPGGAFFNSYTLLHTQAIYDGWRAAHPDTRAFSLTRSGFAGLQRNAAAVWSGDVASRWNDLRDQIAAGVNISMSGIPNWTFDIGGFALEPRYTHPTPADLDEWRELNLRWFQFGAFAPLFRSHGEFPYREIYNLAPEGSPVYESLAAYDRLRYRLLPYIYSVAADTWFRDGVIMRGLVMDFPQDATARKVNDEYLLGPDFLVSPVYTYKARTRRVYLPAGGRWYDFATGRAYDGGRWIEADAPLEQMPVFVRAGAIVPTGPAVQYTGEQPGGPITLNVFRGRDGRFDVYEDDGVSNGYQRGESATVPVAYDDRTGAVTIGARRGSYPGMAATRRITVRWIAGPDTRPTDFDAAGRTVTYTGQAVTVRPG